VNILVLHGPNLNLLGERVGDDGSVTLAGVDAMLLERAGELGVEVKSVQSNHEGALVDALHDERGWADAVIVSPDTLAQNGWALRAALQALGKLAVEVHLGARKTSVIKAACKAMIQRKHVDGYLLALEGLAAGKWEKKGKGAKGAKGAKVAPVKGAPLKSFQAKVEAKPAGKAAEPVRPVKVEPVKVEPVKPPRVEIEVAKPRAEPARPEKTLGRQPPGKPKAKAMPSGLSRELIRQKIGERLSGKLTAGALASWARAQWLEVQRGAPAESGHREELEEALQSLTTSVYPGSQLTEEELVSLMAQLES
jgi:3-dehydroquinate dehydratase-2